ncbi:MAG: cytochrome c biogenesis protein CcsA [Verrucomicrobia bacterium]|nr:cytochrome c biogenesis protein CcsA [Verrucomicrobiota bacterium]
MDRRLLFASTLCFLLAFIRPLLAQSASGNRFAAAARWTFPVLSAGFLLQTAFLYLRGRELGRCPLTNLFEVMVFVSWATVLFYFLVGNAYRLSPLGAFTAPLAFVLQAVALLAPLDRPPSGSRAVLAARVDPWLEFHAAFSVLAYGAFALAAISGALYLWQERQLKSRHLGVAFFQLPPIGDLGRVNGRLLALGFALLTLGLAAGWVALGVPSSRLHFGWALTTWLLYGFLAVAALGWKKLAPRRLATLSVLALVIAFATLWGITFIPA